MICRRREERRNLTRLFKVKCNVETEVIKNKMGEKLEGELRTAQRVRTAGSGYCYALSVTCRSVLIIETGKVRAVRQVCLGRNLLRSLEGKDKINKYNAKKEGKKTSFLS